MMQTSIKKESFLMTDDEQEEFTIISENDTNRKGQELASDSESPSITKDKTYACDDCEYESKNKLDLKTHKLSEHTGVKAECDQCEKSFFDNSTMRRHKRKYCLSISLGKN